MLTGQRAARWGVVAFAIAAIGVHGRPSRAAAADAEKAEQLIREGNALRRQHQDARALQLFQEAYEISRTPRSAAQLGLAELALGYWDAANEHLTDALTSGRNSWVAEKRHVLEAAQSEARSHLASLTVDGSPAGAEVLVNGKSVGTLPLATPVTVNEGRVEIEVRASAYKSDHRVLTVQGNSHTELNVNLQPAAPPVVKADIQPVDRAPAAAQASGEAGSSDAPGVKQPDAAAPVAELPGWRRVLPWALTAGAIVAGGVGAWQAVEASHSLDQFNANHACGVDDQNRGSDPSCAGLYSDSTSHRTNAWIAFGTAGVFVAGAVTLLIWNANSAPVDVQVGMGTARVAFRGTF
jgi:hypothetical protein